MRNVLLLFSLLVFCTQLKAQIEIPSYKDGIVFLAKDNSFKAKLSYRMQNLIDVTFEKGKEADLNALIRRSRFKLEGFVLNEKWEYRFQFDLSNREAGGSSDLEQTNYASKLILDAVIKYKPNKNLEFWFGQEKVPGNREKLISSSALQFVDRSMVSSSYNLDRDMGVQVHYKGTIGSSIVRVKGSVNLGEGRNITGGNYGGLDYTGRFEYLPLGEFTNKGDYFSADLKREVKPKLALGVTYDLNKDASRQGGQLREFVTDTMGNEFFTDLSTLFIDAIFKYNGYSFQAEYAHKVGDSRVKNGIINPSTLFRTGTGLNLQMGYLFKNNIEVAGRYSSITPDNYSSLKELSEYTLALSKYLVEHKLKIQTDFGRTDYATSQNGEPSYKWRFQIELGF